MTPIIVDSNYIYLNVWKYVHYCDNDTSGLMEMSYFPIFVYVNILKLLLEYIYIIFNAIALTYFYIQYKHHS